MATVEDVRWLGSSLERSYQVYVRGRLKFRVEQIVYVAFSLDEMEMGFAFPKEERAALVAAQPHRFHLPRPSDLRFNWVEADLAALDPAEACEFVVDAWRMVVPKKVSRAYDLAHPDGPGRHRRLLGCVPRRSAGHSRIPARPRRRHQLGRLGRSYPTRRG